MHLWQCGARDQGSAHVNKEVLEGVQAVYRAFAPTPGQRKHLSFANACTDGLRQGPQNKKSESYSQNSVGIRTPKHCPSKSRTGSIIIRRFSDQAAKERSGRAREARPMVRAELPEPRRSVNEMGQRRASKSEQQASHKYGMRNC